MIAKVSDGIIAPGFTEEALAILRKKKNGGYCVLQIDPNFVPEVMERRILFGLYMEQRRNDALINRDLFKNVVTNNKNVRSVKLTGKSSKFCVGIIIISSELWFSDWAAFSILVRHPFGLVEP